MIHPVIAIVWKPLLRTAQTDQEIFYLAPTPFGHGHSKSSKNNKTR
jgi:hypothetical protein